MEAPFKLNLNGVEMEVKPPFDLYFIPIDNPTTFNTIFSQPPPPWALLFRAKWKTI